MEHHIRAAVRTSLSVRLDWIGDEGLDLDEPLSVEWLSNALGRGSPYKPAAEGRLRVHLMLAERVVHVRGRVAVNLAAACVRCLRPVPLQLDLPIETALFPRGDEPAAAADGELGDDDMGIGTYDGEEIDLAGLVHDEVFLELPMNLVCVESCAGLCPQCGTNLNEGRCNCAPEVDPRWQALHGLRLD